jgi:hypothetical protein
LDEYRIVEVKGMHFGKTSAHFSKQWDNGWHFSSEKRLTLCLVSCRQNHLRVDLEAAWAMKRSTNLRVGWVPNCWG